MSYTRRLSNGAATLYFLLGGYCFVDITIGTFVLREKFVGIFNCNKLILLLWIIQPIPSHSNVVLLLSFQNNLERSEFEARTRLGSQVDTLQRELNLLKKKLESEEKHHKGIISTWEVSQK